jgi:hypothetical protein
MTEPLEQEDAVRWMSELGQTGTTVHRGGQLQPPNRTSGFSVQQKPNFSCSNRRERRAGADGRFAFGSFTNDLGQLCAAAVTVRLLEVRTDCDEE